MRSIAESAAAASTSASPPSGWRAITSSSIRARSQPSRSHASIPGPREMAEQEQHDREFDILAPASAGTTTRVLKHGETFSVCDRYGDLIVKQKHEAGIYHHGTRFLSRYLLEFNGARPSLLSSTVVESNDLL